MSRHTKQGEEERFIVPVVSLATVRGCRLNRRGHLCHSIHASQAVAEVREGGGVAVALLSADVVERHGLDVSRLVLSGHRSAGSRSYTTIRNSWPASLR